MPLVAVLKPDVDETGSAVHVKIEAVFIPRLGTIQFDRAEMVVYRGNEICGAPLEKERFVNRPISRSKASGSALRFRPQ
jgi:hypothetical protein